MIHPLARMLPALRFQQQVYRLGEKNPPAGSMVGHSPHWAITELGLAALATQQVRMNLQPDFHWLAVTASSSVATQTPATTPTFPITEVFWNQGTAPANTGQVLFWLFIGATVSPPSPAIGETLTLSGLTTVPQANGLIYTVAGVASTDAGGNVTQVITPGQAYISSTDPGWMIFYWPFATPPPISEGNEDPETGTVTATVTTFSTGNFRAQIYDTAKALRMADRGVRFENLGGGSNAILWLRDPYHFDLPDPQVLLVVQNLSQMQNSIQIALYGQVLRFNQVAGTL
jgi:hypothetical protein